MKPAAQIARLKAVADLVRDADLARLKAASHQKARTEALLAALDPGQPPAGLDPIVAAQVVDRFGLWTTNRRILLNQQLARDTVAWMTAKAAAQRSFGRADVLGKLMDQ